MSNSENIAREALREAKKAVGTVKLAQGLGIRSQAVSGWYMVPPRRVLDVERLSGVPRWRLRPDLYPSPEAAA
ncbi:MAG: hypothetical protein EPN20_12430 [Magnetospirillum sp.]|nr:MAG: hypothetical protein EPN20_12430 [Magnetospirillum sp.]